MSDFFLHNNLIVGSTTGIQFSGANVVQVIEKYNAFFGNTSNLNYGTPDATDQILTAGPFVNPGGAVNKLSDAFVNFALNSTAGGGALCRGAGTPAYLDIGAVQSAPSGGSSGYPRIVVPRRRY